MQADQVQVLLQSVDGRIFGCSSRRVVRVLPSSPPRVLVVYDTTTYRRLAKTQVGKATGLHGSCVNATCVRLLHEGAGICRVYG